jgi:hypothetical protein
MVTTPIDARLWAKCKSRVDNTARARGQTALCGLPAGGHYQRGWPLPIGD